MEPEYFHAAYQCLVCPDYGAAELSMMKDHVREHLGLSPYECYHCHKNFTCVRTFKAHAEVLGIPYFRWVQYRTSHITFTFTGHYGRNSNSPSDIM